MLPRVSSYEALLAGFAWEIPRRYNIGVDTVTRHADGSGRPALLQLDALGRLIRTYSFDEIEALTNRFANVLRGHGIGRGERVAVLLGQAPETAIAHIAAFKAACISVPLFTLFGADALRYRLADSGAAALVTDAEGAARIAPLRHELPALRAIFVTEGDAGGNPGFHQELGRASDRFDPAETLCDEPAIIIYTSGTTGQPKGALHGHRVLLGHLPGVELPHEFFPAPGDRFWTPADWAWIGGLFDVLLPAWHHGVPVVAHRMRKFDPERAADVMARYQVRNVFMPPTGLKLMRQAAPSCAAVSLRSLASGGETLGEELLDWGRATFGLTINEFYGQTECNLIVGNAAGLFPVRPGSMGRPIPGHRVGIVDGEGRELGPDEVGQIAVRRPDPVMFLGYWNNEVATRAKFAGDWLLTGDLGRRDADGHIWFTGRADDVITSAGYRIGPAEIEDCLMRHPAVAMAAVVGVPDPVRTEAIRAYVVLRAGRPATDALAAELQDFVATRLAAHERPRSVVFVDELPMTATGKIQRRVLRERG